MRGLKLHIICFWALLLAVTACGDDEYYYPSVQLEFVTVEAGADGTLQRLIPDKGEALPISKDRTGSTIASNSSRRVLSNYEKVSSGGVSSAVIYAVQSLVAPEPKSRNEDPYKDGVVTDPVDVTSIWLGGGYLNMILNLKVKGDVQHVFGMVEEEVIEETPFETEVTLLLYHNASGDLEWYNRRAYISVPLSKYVKEGQTKKVTVRFKYYTYDKAGNKLEEDKYMEPGFDYVVSGN